MSDFQAIEGALKRATARRRLERMWRGLWRGLLVGGALWLVVFAVYKVFPISSVALVVAAYTAGAIVLISMLWAAARRLTLIETARWIDQKRGLKERLSTAWELGKSTADEHWQHLVTADAAKHINEVNARTLLPLRLPVAGRWALLIVVLCAGLGFVPEYRSKAYVQKQAEIEQVRDTGKHLADLTRRTLQDKPPALEQTEKSLESLTDFGEKLTKATLSRSEALRELTSVAEKLDKEAKQLTENPALKRMERAAREAGGSAGAQSPGDLQKQIQSLQDKLGQSANNPNALDKMNDALQKAQQAMANLGNQNSAEAQAAKEQLAQSLGELAQQMRDMGHPMPDLEEAIKALQQNQTDMVVKNLQMAVNDLEKLRQMQKTLEKLQQQAGGVGKDLPEQLQYGQTQAAQKRLEQMSDELKSGQLSQEQLQKMMDEVSRAIEPGSQYNNVGELLKQASQQMQNGNKGQAADSLAQAAKELQKLQQQLGDVQALMAAMDALDRAELALMTGKKWEECQGPGCKACNGEGCKQCRKGGWGQGGRGAHGVGTWADETGWVPVPDEQHATDNSGINRPDMDPRGVADRPANVNPNLLPTKVRGQMSQGGPMPSITLKGVSIKGQSTVEYEQAAAAAQNDAQSALNQDKVPRAYQNAVRDYFDDINKKQ